MLMREGMSCDDTIVAGPMEESKGSKRGEGGEREGMKEHKGGEGQERRQQRRAGDQK